MANLTVWGIDIGNSAIKAVKMTRNGDQITLDDYRVVPIEFSENDDNRNTRVMDAIGQLSAQADLKKNYAYVSIAGNLALFKEFLLDDLPETKDIKKLIEIEAKQQIAISLDEVEWRYEIYEQGGKKGVMIVAVRKTIISELIEQFDKFGIKLAGITTAPIALTNFIQYEYRPEGTVTLLDSGMRSTDFVVLEGKHLFFRPLGIAGKDITQAVMEIFKFDHDKAEDLKKKINSMQPKQAEKIMKKVDPLLRNLASEVHRSIGFYKSKNKGTKITKLFLFGYTFRLPNMADIIARQVREAPALLIEAPQRLRITSSLDQKKFDEDFPSLPVAIGLGLQGLGEKSIDINLSNMKPPEQTEEAKNRSKWLAIAGVVLLAASLVVGLFTSFRAQAIAKNLTEARAEVTARKKQQTEVAAIFTPTDGTYTVTDELLLDQRLVSISKDATLSRQIYDQVSGLPSFTSANTGLKLAHVYIGRVPPTIKSDSSTVATTFPKISEIRADVPGFKLLYSYLEGVGVDTALPAEAQVDPPLVVVLTVEAFKDASLSKFDQVRNDLLAAGIVRNLRKDKWHERAPVGSEGLASVPDMLLALEGKFGQYTPEILTLDETGKPTKKTDTDAGGADTTGVPVVETPKPFTTTGARLGFVYFCENDRLPKKTAPAEGAAH